MNALKTYAFKIVILVLIGMPCLLEAQINDAGCVSLNGKWQVGFARKYTDTVDVPGIATDPTKMNDDKLWYKREIKLPDGSWTAATLELKGARFQPSIYINSDSVDGQEGGMAPLFFELKHAAVKPGNTITLEIALASLKNMSPSDASFIPYADHFRSNVSSELWDDVVLHLHGGTSIGRIIPFIDFKNQKVSVQYDLEGVEGFTGTAVLQVISQEKRVVASVFATTTGLHNHIDFSYRGKLKNWSPEEPNLYWLQLTIEDNKHQVTDRAVQAFGVKLLVIKDKQFYLNENHFVARGPTVVWHRWMRTPEGQELGYDTAWFNKNIIQRTKDLGGNYLRYHLGLPPERLLDLCDKYGLAVQFEWSFFHGMPASKESLLQQYKSWLDLAMRHPSVSFIHPYNETGGDQLKTAWSALDELLKAYPPLLLEDRDVIHIHKYWWSLFENLGLFYDSANVFPKAIMSDEFGGNYLDEKGNPGSYSTVKETFLRFLGRTHTAEQRLLFQAQANAKVAEYWRRIGAAGFSPFCALASNEDGNTWFLGKLQEGNPKPVWKGLSAAFSPQAASMDIWDRNFVPGQQLIVPVYIFNDEARQEALTVKLTAENKAGKISYQKSFTATVNAFSKKVEQVAVTMPVATGDYRLKAELMNRPKAIKQPVISAWDIRVYKAVVPAAVKALKIGVADDETELKDFLKSNQLTTVAMNDASADVLLTSVSTWNKIAKGNASLSNTLQSAIMAGKSVVMLDAGDRKLGQGYPEKESDFGPLQGVATVRNPVINSYNLFGGITLKFTEAAEPESHLHPDKNNRELWNNLPDEYTRLWNGLRGGLIVPAADMAFSGLNTKAFVAQWKARGADQRKMTESNYYAYELQGFYEFADKPDDKTIEKKLKDKVFFLVQDAPALANSINPNSPITRTDLSKGLHDAEKGMAENLVSLASCGKNLTRTPVALIDFGAGEGKLIVSQLLTSGRLAKGFSQPGLYGIRYDEVAVQYVLNMIQLIVK